MSPKKSSVTPHPRVELYKHYPASSVLIYNSVTIAHFLLGAIGITLGYSFLEWKTAYAFGLFYLALAVVVVYILMPLTVCPNCFYYRTENTRCISGLNVLSQRVATEGKRENFPNRAKGLLCHNNFYLAVLAIPLLAILVALVLNFSVVLLVILILLVGLLLFRFLVLFPRLACRHCNSKHTCPLAR